MSRAPGTTFWLILLTLMSATAANAEMEARWQEARAISNTLSSRACEGDEAAWRMLRDRADIDPAL